VIKRGIDHTIVELCREKRMDYWGWRSCSCFCSSHDTKFSKALWEDTLIFYLTLNCLHAHHHIKSSYRVLVRTATKLALEAVQLHLSCERQLPSDMLRSRVSNLDTNRHDVVLYFWLITFLTRPLGRLDYACAASHKLPCIWSGYANACTST
jgi:hypothetical protein